MPRRAGLCVCVCERPLLDAGVTFDFELQKCSKSPLINDRKIEISKSSLYCHEAFLPLFSDQGFRLHDDQENCCYQGCRRCRFCTHQWSVKSAIFLSLQCSSSNVHARRISAERERVARNNGGERRNPRGVYSPALGHSSVSQSDGCSSRWFIYSLAETICSYVVVVLLYLAAAAEFPISVA